MAEDDKALQHARACFELFERGMEEAGAGGKLSDAIDAVLDIVEGDYSAEIKRRARNLISAYRSVFVARAERVLAASGGVRLDTYEHYRNLAELFVEEYPEKDKNVEAVKSKLAVKFLREEWRWLSQAEKEDFGRLLGMDVPPAPGNLG